MHVGLSYTTKITLFCQNLRQDFSESGRARFSTVSRAEKKSRSSSAGDYPKQKENDIVTGLVFNPMQEVQYVQSVGEEDNSNKNIPKPSMVRMHFSDESEAAINQQINVEYNISYIYHSMSAYFDRDTVALPGLAKYFRKQSDQEKGHAQKLVDFLNTRGGRVKLAPLAAPESEFFDTDRGDALFAFELSLSLERLNYEKLLHCWEVMESDADAEAAHFMEYMLEEQSKDVKEVADFVSQLRRVGKGLGVWQFDHELYKKNI